MAENSKSCLITCAYDLKFGEVGDDKEDSSVTEQWGLVVKVGES